MGGRAISRRSVPAYARSSSRATMTCRRTIPNGIPAARVRADLRLRRFVDIEAQLIPRPTPLSGRRRRLGRGPSERDGWTSPACLKRSEGRSARRSSRVSSRSSSNPTGPGCRLCPPPLYDEKSLTVCAFAFGGGGSPRHAACGRGRFDRRTFHRRAGSGAVFSQDCGPSRSRQRDGRGA